MRFAGFDMFVFDMQGVLISGYLLGEALKGYEPPRALGGHEVIKHLKQSGKKVRVYTSASHLSSEDVHRVLRGLGFDLDIDEIYTASQATAEYLRQKNGPSDVWVVGEEGLVKELERYGHRISRDANVVVVGFCTRVDGEQLNVAASILDKPESELIAAIKIRIGYHGLGTLVPAALVAALETHSGKKAVVVGKPAIHAYRMLLKREGVQKGRAVMVGDSFENDIKPAIRCGYKGVLIMSERIKKMEGNVDHKDILLKINHVDEMLPYLQD
jgi:arabinose operon protein AraL